MTVADFESLVLSQQPATEPWTAVTDYSFEARKAIEGEHPDRIIEAFGREAILDYGCGPDAILIRLLRDRGVMAYGSDPILRPEWKCFSGPWGPVRTIICREVFEHLTVRQIAKTIRLLTEDYDSHFIYATTRFSSEHDLLCVETSDGLDPTHISICSKDLIRLLFVLQGFKQRADLEEKLDWQQKNRCLVYERVV